MTTAARPHDPVAPADAATRQVPARRFNAGQAQERREALVVEAPLQLNINDRAFAVTMRTPGADRELVRGILLTEGILADDATAYTIEQPVTDQDGLIMAINVAIPPVFLCDGVFDRRRLMATAACGICGQREWQELPDDAPPLAIDRPLDPTALPAMYAAIEAAQGAFRETGGCHAAAAFSQDGELLAFYEDVGRHNAVDKVVGNLALARQRGEATAGRAGVLLVSGRVSFEIVLKAYRAGLPFIAAVSAPSSLAVDVGERLGVSVLGFCRDERATVYSCIARVATT